MDLYFFHHDEYERLYNCSLYPINAVPESERKHVFIGWSFLIIFAVAELLYIPCLTAIRRLPHYEKPCFRLMFYIGIADLFVLFVAGFFTGYFAVQGYVFCSAPTLIYFIGNFGVASWGLQADMSIVLALNRMISICDKALYDKLFSGQRLYIWMLPPAIHSILFLIFTKPAMFSSIYVSWFFNPYIGYMPDDDRRVLQYVNVMHTVHNITVATVFTSLYVAFAAVFFRKRVILVKDISRSSAGAESSRAMYTQVGFLCATYSISSVVYIVMNYFPVPPLVILVASYLWLLSHALPPLIYVVLNKTLRKAVVRLVHPSSSVQPGQGQSLKLSTAVTPGMRGSSDQ